MATEEFTNDNLQTDSELFKKMMADQDVSDPEDIYPVEEQTNGQS